MADAVRTTGLGGKFESIRFIFKGYSAFDMRSIGTGLINRGILPRIRAGQTIYDSPSKPLADRYRKIKARIAPPAIRNWQLTGYTLRNMVVTSSRDNYAVIGFAARDANARAFYNNRRDRQFGISGRDRPILSAEFQNRGNHTVAMPVSGRDPTGI